MSQYKTPHAHWKPTIDINLLEEILPHLTIAPATCIHEFKTMTCNLSSLFRELYGASVEFIDE